MSTVNAAEMVTDEKSNDEDKNEQLDEIQEDKKKKKKKEKIGFRNRKVKESNYIIIYVQLNSLLLNRNCLKNE